MKANVLLLLSLLMLSSCSGDADLTSTASEAAGTTGTTTSTAVVYQYDTDETQLADLINAHRQSMGLAPFTLVDFISATCEDHNEYMIAQGALSHDGFQSRSALITEVLGGYGISENVAFNYQTGQGAFDGWLNSDGHRAAMEGSATQFGISVTADAQGRKYYTAIFAYIGSGPL